jgi:antitoxin (DNA-binding transcriptional repressor) of toxin-antitoxin stability system
MKRIDVRDAKDSLAEYARELHDEALVLTDHGKPVAALLPVENADDETVALSTNRRFIEMIESSRARQRAEGGSATEKVRRRLGGSRSRKSPA